MRRHRGADASSVSNANSLRSQFTADRTAIATMQNPPPVRVTPRALSLRIGDCEDICGRGHFKHSFTAASRSDTCTGVGDPLFIFHTV